MDCHDDSFVEGVGQALKLGNDDVGCERAQSGRGLVEEDYLRVGNQFKSNLRTLLLPSRHSLHDHAIDQHVKAFLQLHLFGQLHHLFLPLIINKL